MFFNVAHKDINIVVYSKLVLEVVPRVRDQESVASLNQLVVLLVVVCNSVDTLFYDL